MKNLRSKLGNLFSTLFGQISWSCPPWLKKLCHKTSSKPSLAFGILGGLLVLAILIATAMGVYHYIQNRPKPNLITASITVPPITPGDKVVKPQPLVIEFSSVQNFWSDSTKGISLAPLNSIGKTISKGVTISPTVSGDWSWTGENELTFMPNAPWPAGKTYRISFDKTLFAKKVNMQQWQYDFATMPFTINISQFHFYLDLKNPNLRELVATLHFNYPVNPDSLKSETRLIIQAIKNDKLNLSAQDIPLTLSYDKDNWTAYIHAPIAQLPEMQRYVMLYIDKGVKPVQGEATDEVVQAKTILPDEASVLKVNDVSATIVRDKNDQPEQVLNIATSIGVTTKALTDNFHVYLLPKDLPATADQPAQEDYNWQNPGEVTPAMLTEPLTLTTIPSAHDYDQLHSFKFKIKPDRYVYITINKNMQGYNNFLLAQSYQKIVAAPEYPKEISFLHKGSLLALSSEKKFSVVIRGIPAVKFTLARVLPTDLNHFITQTTGSFQNPDFINDSFDATNISQIFSETRQFTDDTSTTQYVALDLAKYLDAQAPNERVGLFLIKAQSWDVKNNQPTDTENNRLILMTDMGLLVKDNNDGTHDVFIQSITTGEPVAGVAVSVLGKNGLSIANATTDQDGHAHISDLRSYNDIPEKNPTLYIARKGNDVSFIPYSKSDRQLNFSRFDIDGVNASDGLSAYLFSDRGIYRPGETIHIGMIAKGPYVTAMPAGLPLEAIITDPRGVKVLDTKLNTNETGYLTLDYPTTETTLTGQYNVDLYIIKDNNLDTVIGNAHVNVEEFQPDKLKMQAQFQPTPTAGWISSVGLSAKVKLMNLYGTAATNRKISANLLLSPQPFVFNQYANYVFINPLIDPKKPFKEFREDLSDGQTNDQGEAEFKLNLDRFQNATYQLTFSAEGFAADGGRGVSSQTSALVSPLKYLVGYKPDGDLFYIKQNTPRAVNLIAIAPDLKQINLENLQLHLVKLNTVSTLIQQDDGTYQYQSVIQEVPINTENFTIAATSDYKLPTQEIGDYKVFITDAQGLKLTTFNFSVVGPSQLAMNKNAELGLKLNKKNYAPGDVIEMQITAPYAGAGLITIERDKVYAYKWFKTSGTNSVQTIVLPKNFKGTGYINVAFVRDWDSDQVFISPLSYSIAPFSVIPDDSVMHVHLNTPSVMRPGQPLTIQYNSDKPGKIILFAVDEGILQVANYVTPDPVGYFFQKEALNVTTSQIVDQILPKFIAARELSAIGGGEGAEALAKNLNPFRGKNQKPVVYWSGIVDTDNTNRQVTYQVPDYFNGTLRVMAVAAGLNSAGAAAEKLLVQDYFILTPNAPTFVAPGDTFEVSVTVANNDKESAAQTPIVLKLNTNNQFQVIGNATQTLNIAPGTENTTVFNLKATDQLGPASITFIATGNNKSSQQTVNISIRPATAYQTNVISGYAKKDTTVNNIRNLYPQFRTLTAAISTNPLILVGGLQNYMSTYPYGCTEQLVSKAMVQLNMTNQPGFSDQQDYMKQFNEVIQLLRQRQTSEGGFAYWPAMQDNYLNQFATVYAVDFLTEAKSRGLPVPPDLLSYGINYLKKFAISDANSLSDARYRAYAIYVLTRNEIVTTNAITNLQLYLQQHYANDWRGDISSVYLAAAYEMLINDTEAEKLISGYQKNPINKITDDFYDNQVTNSQYLTILARYFPDRLRKLGPDALLPLTQSLQTNALDSISAAFTSLALSTYAQVVNPAVNDQNLAVQELFADNSKKLLILDNQQTNFDDTAQKLQFISKDNNGYFYQVTQSGFDKSSAIQPIKQGLEIYRQYEDKNKNVISKVPLGSEIVVHLRIRSLTNDGYINNVAIVDLLPGGFEVVRNSVSSGDWDYKDVRDDRVIFYGSVGTNMTDITYRIRAVNKGTYTTPAPFAAAMYNATIRAQGVAGQIVVN